MQGHFEHVITALGKTDVYLIDQMMKGMYQPTQKILDAGCGHGRNIDLFIQSGFPVYGVDFDPEKINFCKSRFPGLADHFFLEDLEDMHFENDTFDHLISNAVFHFVSSEAYFKEMFAEHIRVLKKGGTFFIRMTSLFGLPKENAESLGEGVYHIPDYGDRFLITYPLIEELKSSFRLSLLEPVKTVNVENHRAMAVIMFQKNN